VLLHAASIPTVPWFPSLQIAADIARARGRLSGSEPAVADTRDSFGELIRPPGDTVALPRRVDGRAAPKDKRSGR